MDMDRYKELLGTPSDYNLDSVVPYLPNPKDIDYQRGYIRRYFIQKANDINSPIYEISTSDINSYKNTFYYVTVSLDWRLVGTPDEVKKSNSESIRIASQTIPKIQLYLPNLLQFYKK